jgi:hypothetical protein
MLVLGGRLPFAIHMDNDSIRECCLDSSIENIMSPNPADRRRFRSAIKHGYGLVHFDNILRQGYEISRAAQGNSPAEVLAQPQAPPAFPGSPQAPLVRLCYVIGQILDVEEKMFKNWPKVLEQLPDWWNAQPTSFYSTANLVAHVIWVSRLRAAHDQGRSIEVYENGSKLMGNILKLGFRNRPPPGVGRDLEKLHPVPGERRLMRPV